MHLRFKNCEMEPRVISPGIMALILILTVFLVPQSEGSLDFFNFGQSLTDELNDLRETNTLCQPDEIFCFQCGYCVTSSGAKIPGHEPTCSEIGKAVCLVDGNLVCEDADKCARTDVKFALLGYRSRDNFVDGYLQQKEAIETALERALGATPVQIYAVELHFDIQSGTTYVTARADPGLNKQLIEMFQDRSQILYDGYGNSIGINWDMSNIPQAINPYQSECSQHQHFCFLTKKCVDNDNDKPCDKHDDGHDDLWTDSCKPGQHFCFLTKKCVDDEKPCDKHDDDDDDVWIDFCRPGQHFCFMAQKCVDSEIEKPCDKHDDDDDNTWIDSCKPGQHFCFLTKKCVDNPNEKPCDKHDDDDDDVWTDFCRPGQHFCFSSKKCVDNENDKPCDKHDDEDDDDVWTDLCRPGQHFCFLTKKCVDNENEKPCEKHDDDDDDDVWSDFCMPGQHFCFLTKQCVDNENPCHFDDGDDDDDNHPIDYCRPSQHFCFLRKQCVDNKDPRHYDDDDDNDDDDYHPIDKCGPDQHFCFLRKQCVDNEDPCHYHHHDDDDDHYHPIDKCRPDQHFCFLRKKCVDNEDPCHYDDDDDDYDDDHYHPIDYCRHNQHFCFLRKRCVDSKDPCHYHNDDDDDDDYHPVDKCRPDQYFCFIHKKCVDTCEWKDDGKDDDDDDYPTTDVCGPGQHFCFIHKKCVDTCETKDDGKDDDNDDDYPSTDVCGPGEHFCFIHKKCVDTCDTKDDDDDDYYPSTDICGPGQHFCFIHKKCVDTCDRDDDGKDEDDDDYPPTDVCGPGQHFCFIHKKCVDTCIRDDGKDDDYDYPPLDVCGPGQHFCFIHKKCVDTCDTQDDGKDVDDDYPPTDVCGPGQHFCFIHKKCVDTCDRDDDGKDDDDDDYPPTDVCGPGQHFCFIHKKCVDTCDRKDDGNDGDYDDDYPPLDVCGPGQHFCFIQKKCVDTCDRKDDGKDDDNDDDYPSTDVCGPGQHFCFIHKKCVDTCEWKDDDDNYPSLDVCGPGLHFCFITKKCVNTCEQKDDDNDDDYDDYPPIDNCGPGQHFCFITKKCVDTCERKDEYNDEDDDDDFPATDVCGPGQHFCFFTNKCVDACHRQDANHNDDDGVDHYPPIDNCGPGQHFCFIHKKCVDTCDRKDDYNDDDDDDYPSTDVCGTGQHFCFITKKCVDTCDRKDDDVDDDDYDDDNYPPSDICGPGQYFCFIHKKCVDTCDRKDDDDNDDDDDDDDYPPTDICVPGQHFCMFTKKCVDSCDLKDDDTVDDDDDNYQPIAVCGPGQHFCMFTKKCVDPCNLIDDDDVDGKSDDNDDYDYQPIGICQTGQHFCMFTKTCAESCDKKDDEVVDGKSDDNDDDYQPIGVCQTGQSFCFESKQCVDPCEEPSCPADKPVWCEAKGTCVIDGGCVVAAVRDTYMVWATVTPPEGSSFMNMASMKASAQTSFESAFQSASSQPAFTDFSIIPGDKDNKKMAIVAVAEVEGNTMASNELQDGLTGTQISSYNVEEANVWKVLGESAPKQIYPVNKPLIFNQDVIVDLSFLSDTITDSLSTLTLNCQEEDVISIKVNDDYVSSAVLATRMVFKVKTETTRLSKCEIQGLPDLTGATKYYLGFTVLSMDLVEMSKINSIEVADIPSIDEDAGCQPLPENLFSVSYEGDELMSLFVEPKWPETMIGNQENWIGLQGVIQAVESIMTEYFENIMNRRFRLRTSLYLKEGQSTEFNDKPLVKFRFKGEELKMLDRSELLLTPRVFEYCLADDFSGSVQLEIAHWPTVIGSPVRAPINIQVTPLQDRPKAKVDVDEMLSEFSFPKLSDSPTDVEFSVQTLANLWFTDIDYLTDPSQGIGLAVIGVVTPELTISGEWSYLSGTTWQSIASVSEITDEQATGTITVSVTLLQPDQTLKFTPDSNDIGKIWQMSEAPRLAVAAWDMSNLASLSDPSTDDVVIEKCRKSIENDYEFFCVEGISYSTEIKIVKLPRLGCDDQPGSGKNETNCGCGEIENSCRDCEGTLHGNAKKDVCGVCSGGRTEVNCSEEVCREYSLANKIRCENEEKDQEILEGVCPIDGEIFNECHKENTEVAMCIPVGTSLDDLCGEKCGQNECLDCAEEPFGTKKENLCGVCTDPENQNEGCSIGDIMPENAFAFSTLNMTVTISTALITNNPPDIECRLVPQENTQVEPDVSALKYAGGKIKFTTTVAGSDKALSVGLYAVACTIDGNDVSTADNQKYHRRFSHPSVTSMSPDSIVTDNFPEYVTITGDGFYDTDEVYCIMLHNNNYRVVAGVRKSNTEITCDVAKLLKRWEGKQYGLNVILNKKKFMEQELTSLPNPHTFTVKLPAPGLVSAQFHHKNCKKILIKFDTRITGDGVTVQDTSCSNYFDSSSLAKIGASATCIIQGGQLMINDFENVADNTILTVLDNVIKAEKETANVPNYFSGDVTVTVPENTEFPPVFIRSNVPNLIGCKSVRVNITVKNRRCWTVSITWTASSESPSDPTKITELNTYLGGKDSFKLSPNQLGEDPVTFRAEWVLVNKLKSTVTTTAWEEITIAKDTNAEVALRIDGVEKLVEPFSVLNPSGHLDCFLGGKTTKIWTLEPGSFEREGPSRPKIKGDLLKSDTYFTLTFKVKIDNNGITEVNKSINFMTKSIPPVASILYYGQTAGNNEIAIIGYDLPLSCANVAENADSSADLSYRWIGTTNAYVSGQMLPIMDFAALVTGQYTRQEYLTSDVTIPKEILVGDNLRQEWTCEIQQGTYSSAVSTQFEFVEVSTIEVPEIETRQNFITITPNRRKLKIRAKCKFTTMYKWYADPGQGEDWLFEDIHTTTIVPDDSLEKRYCGITIPNLRDLDLSPDVLYPLTLEAINEKDGDSRSEKATFFIEYLSYPTAGTIEASYEGITLEALTGYVTFTLSGWDGDNDEETDLRCKLYYHAVTSTSRKIITPTEISAIDIVEDVTFPVGEFIVEATCCNPSTVATLCTTVEMQGTLTVTAPALINFLTILDSIEIKFVTGDTSFISAIVSVCETGGLTAEEKVKAEEITSAGLEEELTIVTDSDVEPGSAIENLVNINQLAATMTEIEFSVKLEIISGIQTIATGLSGTQAGSRRKRETTTNNGITVAQAEALLQGYNAIIDGDPVPEEFARGFKSNIEIVMLGLCSGEDNDGATTLIAASDHATVTMTEMSLIGQDATEFNVSCDGCASITYPAKVVYGAEIASTYGNTDYCVSSSQILVDTYSPLSGLQNTRMSDIVVLQLVNPDGVSGGAEIQTVTGLASQSVIAKLVLTNDTLNTTAYDYLCLMWVSDAWSSEYCNATDPTMDSGISKYRVQCACNALGVIGVFRQVKVDEVFANDTTTQAPTTSTTTTATTTITQTTTVTTEVPSVTIQSSTVYVELSVTCTDNYATNVPDGAAFHTHVKSTLVTATGISSNNIRNLNSNSGSIVITFELHPDGSSTYTLGQMVYILMTGFNSGTITLTNTNGDQLTFQAGSFMYREISSGSSSASSSTKTESSSANTGIIVGATLAGLAIIGIAVVAVVFILKKYGKSGRTHPSRPSTPNSVEPYDAPPAYTAPPPPPYLYEEPPCTNQPYPEANKWIENELLHPEKPTGSRPSSQNSVLRLLEKKQGLNEPTPVDG